MIGGFFGVHTTTGPPAGCGGGGGAANFGSVMMRRAGADRRAAMVEGDRLRRLLSLAAAADSVGARGAGSTSIAMGPAQLEGPATSSAGGVGSARRRQGPWPCLLQ